MMIIKNISLHSATMNKKKDSATTKQRRKKNCNLSKASKQNCVQCKVKAKHDKLLHSRTLCVTFGVI